MPPQVPEPEAVPPPAPQSGGGAEEKAGPKGHQEARLTAMEDIVASLTDVVKQELSLLREALLAASKSNNDKE